MILDRRRLANQPYHAPSGHELRPGGAFRSLANEGMKAMGTPDVVTEGEVREVDPRRLVQTWRMPFEPAQSAEPFTTVTWETGTSAGSP